MYVHSYPHFGGVIQVVTLQWVCLFLCQLYFDLVNTIDTKMFCESSSDMLTMIRGSPLWNMEVKGQGDYRQKNGYNIVITLGAKTWLYVDQT